MREERGRARALLYFVPLTASYSPLFRCMRLGFTSLLRRITFNSARMSSTAASAPNGGRTYADAINCLNSLQSNAATIEAIRQGKGKSGDELVAEGVEYLQRIGYKVRQPYSALPPTKRSPPTPLQPADLNALNVLHVTGTKGKGSTSAFTDSILRSLAPNARTGLYTSPHMVAVRERIRIDGKPIEEEMFAQYFFEVWEKLERDTQVSRVLEARRTRGLTYPTQTLQRADPDTPEKPVYFRYLTLLAFHVFLREKVDATILEVGIGGTYDSTNVVPAPITTGVTSLGIDHIFVLGKTLPEIAHQKGGIYKVCPALPLSSVPCTDLATSPPQPDVPALAVDQPAEGLDVLRSRAAELGAQSFTIIPQHPQLSSIKLGASPRSSLLPQSMA